MCMLCDYCKFYLKNCHTTANGLTLIGGHSHYATDANSYFWLPHLPQKLIMSIYLYLLSWKSGVLPATYHHLSYCRHSRIFLFHFTNCFLQDSVAHRLLPLHAHISWCMQLLKRATWQSMTKACSNSVRSEWLNLSESII